MRLIWRPKWLWLNRRPRWDPWLIYTYNGGKRLLVRKGTAQLAIIKNAKLDQPLHNIYSTMDDSNYLLSSCKVECVEDELRVGKKKNVNKYFSLLSIFFQTNPDSLFFTAAYYATKSNNLNPLNLDDKISVPVAMAISQSKKPCFFHPTLVSRKWNKLW